MCQLPLRQRVLAKLDMAPLSQGSRHAQLPRWRIYFSKIDLSLVALSPAFLLHELPCQTSDHYLTCSVRSVAPPM